MNRLPATIRISLGLTLLSASLLLVLHTLGVGGGCLHCHAFRGVGSRAGHLRALDAQPQGGFALPLVEYPPEVWRRFVFEPRFTAKQLGLAGHPVAGAAAQALHELIEREREQAR